MRSYRVVLQSLCAVLAVLLTRVDHGHVAQAAGGLSISERGALKMLFWATDGRNWKNTWPEIQNEHSDPCLNQVSEQPAPIAVLITFKMADRAFCVTQWYGIVCDENGKLLSM